jgi:UDP-N-acetyl-D-glucosamine dehydrogenase
MPYVTVGRVQDALNEDSKPMRDSRVLVLGVAYKPNVRDHRESPALEVIRLLLEGGADVAYADPLVPEVAEPGIGIHATPPTPAALRDADCVLLLCDHDGFDYQSIVSNARLVVDTRNALARRGVAGAARVVLL